MKSKIVTVEIKLFYCLHDNKAYSEHEIENTVFFTNEEPDDLFIPCTVEIELEFSMDNSSMYLDNVIYKNLEIQLDKAKVLDSFIKTYPRTCFNKIVNEALFQHEEN